MRAKKKKAKDKAADRARLAAVRKMLSADPEGKKLLALARKKRVPISFSDKPEKMNANGLFDIDSKTVTLNPAAKDKLLGGVLAHELRHLWQTCVADLEERKISAADMLVRRRVIESDAFAYETRFSLAPQLRMVEDMSKIAAKKPKSPEAIKAMKIVDRVRAQFGMKAAFMKAQKQLMPVYDKMTLRSLALELKLARIYAEEKKFLDAHPSKSRLRTEELRKCNKELKGIFNHVSAPQPLEKSLIRIIREGLSPRSPNYLGITTTAQLAAVVRKQIPSKTLTKARALEKKIRKTAGRAIGRE